MFSFKSFVLVIVFAYVGLGFAETTIKVSGQLQCCSDGLVFLLGSKRLYRLPPKNDNAIFGQFFQSFNFH
jgi:hypothetical protein